MGRFQQVKDVGRMGRSFFSSFPHRRSVEQKGKSIPTMKISILREVPIDRLTPLIEASIAEGYQYLTRLRTEWLSGQVRFDGSEEAFFVAETDGAILGVCGLTQDPEAQDPQVGRVRKMYVHPTHRRQGLGTQLLHKLCVVAQEHFREVRVRTRGPSGYAFYESLGFRRAAPGRSFTHFFPCQGPVTQVGGTVVGVSETPSPEAVSLTPPQASTLLGHWLGNPVACQRMQPLAGGICSAVFRLDFGRPPYAAVLKLSNPIPDPPFRREQERLDYLHQHTQVPCPRVYLQDNSGKVIPYPFLLLEYWPGVNLESASLSPAQRVVVEQELAEVLLELHSHQAERFHDLGEAPGVTRWTDQFLPDLEESRRDMEELLPPALLAQLDAVLPWAQEALWDQGKPTLIHNDIWAGNIMVQEHDEGWHLRGLIDPVGLQYAEVEKELAYLQAFNTVSEAFFRVYTAQRPLRPGYEFRKLFYWLHTYMIHVWLGFGTEFHDSLVATCNQILAGGRTSARKT